VASTAGGACLLALLVHDASTDAVERRWKRKPAKFKRVMRDAGVSPAQTIAIGDEVRDIEAARAAGIACAAVTWGFAARAAIDRYAPDIVFERMEDVARVIGGVA
jgi:phosphoglycolate phosphatase